MPVAAADTLTTAIGTAGTVDVLANDSDPDGDPLTLTGSTDGAHGTVTCLFGSCTYTPDEGYSGPDTFTYSISDGRGGTATGTVSVTVTDAPNNPPIAQTDSLTTTAGARRRSRCCRTTRIRTATR